MTGKTNVTGKTDVTGKASVAAETDVTLGSVVSSLVLLGHSSDAAAAGLVTTGLETTGLAGND